MHVLHRPHLPRAMTVTIVAAVVAIVLTLVLAPGIDSLSGASTPSGAAGPPSTLPVTAVRPGWTLSPWQPLLTAPVAVPWAPARR